MILSEYLAKLSFSSSVRQRTWKKLSVQVHHGMSLTQSLEQMKSRAIARKSHSYLVYARALENLSLGHNLGVSISDFATPEEVMLISSGQLSGHLSEGLELASNLLAAKQEIVQSVISALLYPVFLFVMCLVVLFVVSIMVMPKFAMLSDPTKWTGAAGIFYTFTSFVNSYYGMFILLMFVILVLFSLLTLPSWTGKFRQYVENVPPWSIYRLTVGAVWLYTVSTLMRSGAQLSHILETMLNSESISPYLHERVLAIVVENNLGNNLGESMYNSEMNFPDPDLIDDLRVYALMPNFHNRMFELASEWMIDGVGLVKKQSRVLNLVSILLITGLVSIMALSIGSLQSQLLTTGY